MSSDHATHLSAHTLARWVDGAVSAEERPAVEAHLADCLACQEETAAVLALRRHAAPARRVWRVAVPLAAAAVLALLAVTPILLDRNAGPGHRAPVPADQHGPRPLVPVGGAATEGPLVWSRVDGADRYRVTLFAADGSPLGEQSTSDTTLALASTRLAPGARHYWKVEARVGIDRWTASPLVEFVFVPGTPR